MSENQTLAEEEIVHENPCLHFEIKNPILRAIFFTACGAGLFSPIILAYLSGTPIG